MKTLRFIGMALLAVVMCINFTACGSDDKEEIETSSIIGTWEGEGEYEFDGDYGSWYDAYAKFSYTFKTDGTIISMIWEIDKPHNTITEKGKYEVVGNRLMIWWEDDEDVITNIFEIKGNKMTVYTDEGTTFVLTKK